MQRILLTASLLLLACPLVAQDRLTKAVVFLDVSGVNEKGKTCRYTGSAVSVMPGYLITNRHVFPGDDFAGRTVEATFYPGTAKMFQLRAEIVSIHPDHDLSLLKYDADGREIDTLPLGSTRTVKQLDGLTCAGYPLGRKIAVAPTQTPKPTVSAGKVAAIQVNEQNVNFWLDADLTANHGNSGGAIVNERGELVAITAQTFGGFTRGVPVEFVKELLGEQAMVVSLDRDIAPQEDEEITLTVRGRELAGELTTAELIAPQLEREFRLQKQKNENEFVARLRMRDVGLRAEYLYLVVRSKNRQGMQFEQVTGLPLRRDLKTRMQLRINQLDLEKTKSNGFWWDSGEGPDIFANVFVNNIFVKQTGLFPNRHTAFPNFGLAVNENDEIRIVVYDKDITANDLAGDIRLVAKDGTLVERADSGKIKSVEVQVHRIPIRVPNLDR